MALFKSLSGISGMWSQDMAIDLGTANTLVVLKSKGVVLNEPSVVAVITDGGKKSVLAVGDEAKTMLGRTPGNIAAIRPLKDGVIADFVVTEEMIKHFIKKVHKKTAFANPRILICVPTGSTPVERKAIQDSALAAGARKVQLIEEPIAAAIGAGLPISEATGSMVVDIGGGTTEIAVISMGDIVNANSVRVGGEDMTEILIEWLRREHQILVDTGIAENIKHAVGSAYQYDKEPQVTVTGRDIVRGIPKQVLLEASDVRNALQPIVNDIIEAVRISLSQTPPALVSDIDKDGAWLTGGGSLLKQMDKKIAEELGIPVNITDDPLSSVVIGSGICLERFQDYKSVLKLSPKPN